MCKSAKFSFYTTCCDLPPAGEKLKKAALISPDLTKPSKQKKTVSQYTHSLPTVTDIQHFRYLSKLSNDYFCH